MLIDNKKNRKVVDILKNYINDNNISSMILSYFTVNVFNDLKKELQKIDTINLLLTFNSFKNDINILLSTKEENKLQQTKIAKECANLVNEKVNKKIFD